MYPNNQHNRSSQPSIKICEALDCYEVATEVIAASAGKFGTMNLNLCWRCAVTKFHTSMPIPLSSPTEDSTNSTSSDKEGI